ncbi:Nitrogen-fixing NifU domain-containing protein [Capnocytophaga canis]|uniref:Nitrogen-fixing NifU domain-containing protein n=2 Tax=Capnocytophaga canis TaxID=1848903 RepID=A0A0B7INT1_9FLAO|nr:NifU family protein [Capnocytophaga canis]CEN52224.1 Nitrogen-fixing NifU domain-containing protein [Capnocytophaga canis]
MIHSEISKKMTTEQVRENVLRALDEIRPFLQSDGGDITLVDIEDDRIVKVRLEGNCLGCSVNQMTLKSGVEMTVKKYVPQIESVVNIL